MNDLRLTGTVPLTTERLLLRRFTLEDAPAVYETWARDPEVTRFLTWSPHASVEKTRSFLEEAVRGYERDDQLMWAIVLKEPGSLIGSIGARVERAHRRAEIGYCLGRAFWNRGYMTEALREVVRFLFDEVGVVRVQALHFVGNPASGRVMEKAGMRYEGTLRSYLIKDDGAVDALMYAIVRDARTGT
ncbi:GNAT family N-acetyltransferase [Spirochaeta thermophila]|uniref:Putative acetyltransferase n=1 Tax=Winmispira thermophila (strain ATCC 49972 / DSM 6192 / RI 19.B1) TaxID=665571 RepID=E0RP50_WINT6|nr:GNAT family N-acetyltransferase [Spirochaeta thermophila]ADN02712.1 putative acetyltransferase [Spirochaeta thermophila DSM 6192]